MKKGRTKWFDQEKGYGFIERDGGKDLFVHQSNIQSDQRDYLKEGEEVLFESEEKEEGPAAVRVQFPDESDRSENGRHQQPEPDGTFEDLGLNDTICAGPESAGFDAPRPVQNKAIPPLLDGEDLAITAPTGTGKTAAFLLPMFQDLLGETEKQPRGLVLAPTRELADQIAEEGRMLAEDLNLTIDRVVGGTDVHNEKKRLEDGIDVLVATPGRLIDHMSRSNVNFDQLDWFVVDEADRMCDMGFLPQIERIERWCPDKRQGVFCSATIPPEIQELSEEMLDNPEKVSVGTQAPAESISHFVVETEKGNKKDVLTHLLDRTDLESVLVFCRRKDTVRSLTQTLRDRGYDACGLQGDMEMLPREATLDAFRNKSFSILVATNVAARGLDVEHIRHVINYDIPHDPDVYTHRIGRTGRSGLEGNAYTLVTSDDRKHLQDIENTIGYEIESLSASEILD